MAVTITEEIYGSIKKIRFDWTSDAAGAAMGTTTNAYNGEILRAVTIPGAGGLAPTDQYDVNLNDEDSVDVLAGGAANRSSIGTEQLYANQMPIGVVANDKLSIAVSNAGNAKEGTLVVYIR